MTQRDRIVLAVVAVTAVLAGFWFAVLAPKRKEASDLAAQITSETARLDKARVDADAARKAKDRYDGDYATVVRLGKAVPADDNLPSLLYQLESAATGARIDFRSVKLAATGSTGAAPAPAVAQAAALAAEQKGTDGGAQAKTETQPAVPAAASAATAATLPPGATVGTAAFPTMPFTFVFNGSFFDMERFLRNVQDFVKARDGVLDVRGRLLQVDGIALTAGREGFPKVKASINATAYLLPPGHATAAPTPAGPAGAPASGGSGGTASTTATAVGVSR